MIDYQDEGLRRIHWDPHHERTAAVASSSSIKNPVNVPWPTAWHPKPNRMPHAPSSHDPLPKADALVVTWTSGEARTMGQLFASQPLEDWYEYKSNVNEFIPNVTGSKAPFNDDSSYNKRYYHSLGLYCLVRLGSLSVVVLKSGLHPAYDGPAVPLVALWKQMVAQVQPKIVITTGTGGGIGADIKLGDVVLASHTRFHCTGELKDKPFANSIYPCSPLNETKLKTLITPQILQPNGNLLQTPRVPTMVYPSTPDANVVTTDTFAFDDSTDHFKLQGLGKCCDMGDACLGLAMSEISSPPAWVSIRNASDPQIPNPNDNMTEAKREAEQIYNSYQEITTAGSVIATWGTLIAQLGSV